MTVSGPSLHGPGPTRYRRARAARMEVDLRPFRYAGAAMLALGLALPQVPGHPGLPCPLRALTGVPCPFCGLTTSVEAAVSGRFHAAFSANPFGLLVVAFVLAVLVRPRWNRLRVPSLIVATGVTLSWFFELHRFHFL